MESNTVICKSKVGEGEEGGNGCGGRSGAYVVGGDEVGGNGGGGVNLVLSDTGGDGGSADSQRQGLGPRLNFNSININHHSALLSLNLPLII